MGFTESIREEVKMQWQNQWSKSREKGRGWWLKTTRDVARGSGEKYRQLKSPIDTRGSAPRLTLASSLLLPFDP